MESRYVLGIDAGATKTHYALYDLAERRAWLYTGGCGNHEGLAGSYAELREVLASSLEKLLRPLGLTAGDISGAGFGVAGVDTLRQHSIISGIFRELGFRRFGLANDAALGIKCESESGDGLCAVNGTGFSVLGIDSAGNSVQIGGFGEWTDDRGGGGYIAQRVFASVYSHLFKGGDATAMTEGVLRAAGASGEGDLIERYSALMESDGVKEFYRQLSVVLHTCAAGGDKIARAILLTCAEEYARALLGALRRLPGLSEGKLNVVLVGSNFTRCECHLARERIEERLREALPGREIEVKPIRTVPVAGALFWGCSEAGVPAGEIPRGEIVRALRLAQA